MAKDILKTIKDNKNLFINLILLIIAYIVIISVLPIERKFRYEFQKGKPWMHEDLIAPFDFPIYKLPDELNRERDSIINNIKPYFIYDESVEKKVLNQFDEDYRKKWENYWKQDSSLRAVDYNYRRSVPRPNKAKFDTYKRRIAHFLHIIYQKGLLDPSSLPENYKLTENSLIVIYKNNLAQTYSIAEVYTLKKAYEAISQQLDKFVKANPKDAYIISFFREMDFSRYLVPNLIFDQRKTEELTQKALSEISETMGVVQAGERIISKGEVVDLDKYRILLSLKREYEKAGVGSKTFLLFGNSVIVLILLFTLVLFIYNYKPKILFDTKRSASLLLLIVLMITVASLAIKSETVNIYVLPFAIVPVIIKVFFDERMALFVHLITIFIIGFFAPNSFEFVILQFVAGYAAIFSLSKLSRRGQIYISSASVFLALSILYLGIGLTQEGSLENMRWEYFLYFGINAVLVLLAYPLIYAFEKLFGFISDMTLIELSNTNNKLLRRLSLKAPGTFHHSLQVANLAEAAAMKIGADPLLARVGALYHDIGKLYAPMFFIENQISGYNPHENLSFEESAKIIIRHVSEGVALAQKHNLPKQIIDFIRTHHGTTVVQYFYKLYIKQYPDKKDEIEKFRYHGPRPHTRETAIVMMADSIEAASRAMKVMDKEKIDELVENIINSQIEQKQFINTDLTFKDITRLKELFKDMLINMYHPRIEYPK